MTAFQGCAGDAGGAPWRLVSISPGRAPAGSAGEAHSCGTGHTRRPHPGWSPHLPRQGDRRQQDEDAVQTSRSTPGRAPPTPVAGRLGQSQVRRAASDRAMRLRGGASEGGVHLDVDARRVTSEAKISASRSAVSSYPARASMCRISRGLIAGRNSCRSISSKSDCAGCPQTKCPISWATM